MISGNEYDALTRGGRRMHAFKAGIRKATKTKFNRRVRKLASKAVEVSHGTSQA